MSKKLSAAVFLAMTCAFGPMTAGAQDDEGAAETEQNLIEVTGMGQTEGTSNAVTWKRGHGKSKPKISRTGVGNKVTQQK